MREPGGLSPSSASDLRRHPGQETVVGSYAYGSSSHSQAAVPHDWHLLLDSSRYASSFARSCSSHPRSVECGRP